MKSVIQLTTAGFLLAGLLCSQPWAQPVAAPTSTPNKTTGPLLRLLAAKGLVGADEAREIAAADPAQQRIRLAQVLRQKGVLSEAELQEVVGSAPVAGWNNPSPAWVAPEPPPVITAALPISPTVPAPRAVPTAPAAFKAAFPNGGEVSSGRYGCTVELQLPTRAATFTAKYCNGQDLRFYFVGGLYSNFNDAYRFTGQASAPSIDGASTVIFGMTNGVPVIAPQRPLRTQGYSTDLGLPDLGLPLSRCFNAQPGTRSAGWPANMHYGIDMVPARDARRMSGVARHERSGSLHPYAANSSATDFGGVFTF